MAQIARVAHVQSGAGRMTNAVCVWSQERRCSECCACLQWGNAACFVLLFRNQSAHPEERLQGALRERSPVVLPNIPLTSLTTEALFPKAVTIIPWGQSLNRNLGKQTLWISFVVSQSEWMCLQGRGHGLFRASTRQRRQEMHMNPNEHEKWHHHFGKGEIG